MEFPIVYANGDSYTTPSTGVRVHADYLAENLNGFLINNSISGSCNRRIIRSSLYDIIEQRKQNPSQKIIAIISLSFELRSEVWIDDIAPENKMDADRQQESNFVTHSFSTSQDWRKGMFSGTLVNPTLSNKRIQPSKFLDHYNSGRAYFYSPYAERINLLADLIMFTASCKKYNINYLIFRGPLAEQLQSEHVIEFFKAEITQNAQVVDLENFGFCNWCCEQKFSPIDMFDRPTIAHYNSNAHEAFAKQVLLPKLEETKQI